MKTGHQANFLQNQLLLAHTREQFCLYFQPQQILDTGQIHSVEALIRWQHPTKGLQPPDQFIPILEQSGLIIDVGYWVLDQAIQQLETWQAQNRPLYQISINVSPVQLNEPNFVAKLLDRVKHTHISPKWLAIEITESIFVSHMAHTRQMIFELQNSGLEVQMDDFGSGYSSLNELKNLPFDVIKIDREFVKQIDTDARDVVLVEAVIQALHKLDKKVIAEGIENTKQKQILEQLGCDLIQGYFLAKPLPIQHLESFLDQHQT